MDSNSDSHDDQPIVDSSEQSALPLTGKRRLVLSIVIGLSVVLVTVLHFLTPVDDIVWHEIYQRLYYIPIIAAALLFGLRGGLAASLFTTVVYVPHIYQHWQSAHFDYSINQYAETVIFIVVGVVMGVLGDRLKKARERAERSAEQRRTAYIELERTYTELGRTFEQLLQAEKLAGLGELSAGIVHEVRNPLSSIKGAVEILEDEIAPTSPRREFAILAKKEIDRLDNLVGEFLMFARPGAISIEPNNLNDIVASIVTLVGSQAEAESVSVSLDLAQDLEPVPVDREQIKQVLLNLIINALQSMPGGGEIFFRSFSEGDHCVISIEDTGGGIEESIVSKIFDPFFTGRDGGAGLGLSVAHKIVSQHNGTLEYKKGETGSIFVLKLPRRRKS